jgi:hypothetical protein
MNSHRTCTFAAVAALVLSLAAPADAAMLLPLASFGGGDGFLAPGDRAYLTTDNTQRGLAYNPTTGHLLLVNRAGNLSVNVLDAVTGSDLGTLNQGTGIISGGTFAMSMIGVADDGAIYVGNLTTQSTTTPFKIYRWANETSAAPTVAFSGDPLAGSRIGDTLDVMGSGTGTRLVAGYSNNPAVTGNNSFAMFSTSDGSTFSPVHVSIGTNPPAGGDFRFGITFVDSDTVIGKSTTNGRVVDVMGTVGTLNTSFTLDALSINPMDYAVVGGIPVLAAVNTSNTGDSKLWVYNMTNPSSPALLGSLDNLPGPTNANGNGVGQVRFGPIVGSAATIYVLNTNNGIQAFQLVVPEPASVVLLLLAASACTLRRR